MRGRIIEAGPPPPGPPEPPYVPNPTGHVLPRLTAFRFRRYTLATCDCCERDRWFYVWYGFYDWEHPVWRPVTWWDFGLRRRIRETS